MGNTQLLDTVNANVVSGHRIAIVGENGCGKSTLLRALAGDNESESDYFTVGAGGITRNLGSHSSSVLLVEQDNLKWSSLLHGEEEELQSMTIFEALDLHEALNEDPLEDDSDTFRRLWISANKTLEWHIANYETTPIGNLSPGCALRAYLAIALLRYSIEILLLDECGNHLDIPSILFLEHAIVASGKTIIMVSHDAALIDAACDHLWVIDKHTKTMAVSGARYSDFRRAEQLAREHQMAAYEKQQKRHKQLTSVANKLRDASAAGAHHIAKDNDKLQRDFRRDRAGRSGRKAKAIEVLRDAQPKVERVVQHQGLKIKITPLGASTQSSIVLSSVKLGYSQPLPLPPISLRIDFGERLAIVGFNGVGKSTLLKSLTRSIEPVAGDISIGRELRIGNLMQEHETLPRHLTPREYFAQLAGLTTLQASSRLIRYGLTRQQVECPMHALNPGARARAILAGFSMRNVNTLILDEPSNHLSENALKEVVVTLNNFEGTAIVVSHNREFLKSIELSRTLFLSSQGLKEVDSIESLVGDIEDSVVEVVAQLFRTK